MSDEQNIFEEETNTSGQPQSGGAMNADQSAAAGQNADAGQSTDTERNAGTAQNAAGAGQSADGSWQQNAGGDQSGNWYQQQGASYSGQYQSQNQQYSGQYQNQGQQYGGQYQNQQYYNPYQNTAGRKKQGQGFGIASLVLGILALVLFCTCINVFFGILSLIFGIIQIVRYEKKGLAIGGIVTSVISVILMFICWGMLLTSDEFIRTLQDELRYYEQYDLDNEMDRFLDDEYLNYNYEDEIMDHHTL